MGKNVSWWALVASLAATLVLGGFGCGEQGKVDQGRVIAFDKDKETVTIINDVKHDAANPDYSGAPVTFCAAQGPGGAGRRPQTRPAHEAGHQDPGNRHLRMPAAKAMKKITYTLIDQKENVGKNSPLVEDKKFPIVDKDKKAITVYSGRQKLLTTFSVPDEYFALPDDTWEAGDEVRIYYKEPGKAARFMNITKTDIFKK